MGEYRWAYEDPDDWAPLSELYRIAPLGTKPPEYLSVVFPGSRYKCLVHDGDELVGAGRAVADGLDVAYIADVAVHPDHQGRGLGGAIIRELVRLAEGHRKIVLYANPGTEGFYERLGFHHMRTAMAIFEDADRAVETGVLERRRR